jgi:hypothetical protein
MAEHIKNEASVGDSVLVPNVGTVPASAEAAATPCHKESNHCFLGVFLYASIECLHTNSTEWNAP